MITRRDAGWLAVITGLLAYCVYLHSANWTERRTILGQVESELRRNLQAAFDAEMTAWRTDAAQSIKATLQNQLILQRAEWQAFVQEAKEDWWARRPLPMEP